MTTKILLRGGCVLTMGRANFHEADVLIEGDTIVEVGPGIRSRDAESIDASGTIVMPGFVDTHRHVWHSLFRSSGDAVSVGSLGQNYEPDDVYAATLIGLLGAIDTGITTVVDWCDINPGSAHLEAAIQGHVDSGARSVLVHATPSWVGNDVRELQGLASLADRGPLLSIAAGVRTPGPGQAESSKAVWDRVRELGLRIHAHVGVDPEGQGGWLAGADGRQLLGEDVTLVQCTHLGDPDFDAIHETSTRVVLTPSTAMTDGVGRPPVQQLIDRGIRPGLGVGSEQLAPGDMFAQMRATISVQHATLFDLKLAGKAGIPNLLNTREVLRYATADGARVAGLGDAVGTLAAGKKADIVVLRADSPNIFPINDPIGAVVWGMDTSNVDHVFVAGRALKRGGELAADLGNASQLANAARRRVIDASSRLTNVASGEAV